MFIEQLSSALSKAYLSAIHPYQQRIYRSSVNRANLETSLIILGKIANMVVVFDEA